MTPDDAERALLAERILAEQEERRRLAELLHDGPVQHLSAIAQMLDAGLASLREGDPERAGDALARSLALARESARDLRALCDDLEPKVLRELGFATAVGALARRLAARHDVEIDLDVDDADILGENAQTALYQILREATDQAVRRGRADPDRDLRARYAGRRVSSSSSRTTGPPERRSTVLEALAERAATLNARFSSEIRYPRGSTIRIDVPPSARAALRSRSVEGNGRGGGSSSSCGRRRATRSSSEPASCRGPGRRSRTARAATSSRRSRRRHSPGDSRRCAYLLPV